MISKFSHTFRQLIQSLLGPESRFYSSLSDIRPLTAFRFNPLKHTLAFQRKLLKSQGFLFQELEGIPLAARLAETAPRIGRSFSHFAGHLYIQDLASMLPVTVLRPKPGEWVLDMCAAPGSKTTQLAALMENRGVIIANDVSLKRLRSLMFNLRRMGVKNTAACKGFGEQYGNLYFEKFHRVLVDPPCSALGTLQKSPEVLSWWTPARSEKLSGIQFRLVESALKALQPGGVLTYSTCTITAEENEGVIDLALKSFPVELETIELPGLTTRPGLTRYNGRRYCAEVSKAIRVYPWDNESEAFFVARLRKTGSFGNRRNQASCPNQGIGVAGDDQSIQPYLSSLADYYGLPPSTFDTDCFTLQRDLYCLSSGLRRFPLSPLLLRAGLPLARIWNDQALLTTEGAHLFGHLATSRLLHLPDLQSLEKYLNRDPLPSPLANSRQVLVCFENAAIGHALSQDGRLLSRFPRAAWRFEFPSISHGVV